MRQIMHQTGGVIALPHLIYCKDAMQLHKCAHCSFTLRLPLLHKLVDCSQNEYT